MGIEDWLRLPPAAVDPEVERTRQALSDAAQGVGDWHACSRAHDAAMLAAAAAAKPGMDAMWESVLTDPANAAYFALPQKERQAEGWRLWREVTGWKRVPAP